MQTANKRKEVTHPHFVAVRLTDAEMALLDQGASTLGISRSEYLRKLLLEKEIKNTVEIVADIEDLRRLVGEYGKSDRILIRLLSISILAENVLWQWRMKSVSVSLICFL